MLSSQFPYEPDKDCRSQIIAPTKISYCGGCICRACLLQPFEKMFLDTEYSIFKVQQWGKFPPYYLWGQVRCFFKKISKFLKNLFIQYKVLIFYRFLLTDSLLFRPKYQVSLRILPVTSQKQSSKKSVFFPQKTNVLLL